MAAHEHAADILNMIQKHNNFALPIHSSRGLEDPRENLLFRSELKSYPFESYNTETVEHASLTSMH